MSKGWFRELKATVNCDHCGSLLYRKVSLVNRRKRHFCDKACLALGRRTALVCETCGAPFSRANSNSRNAHTFCSQSCANGRKKSDGSSYASATSLRNAFKQHELLVCCNRCGWDVVPNVLQTHHKDRDRTHNTIDNIEVLCPNCHAIEHWGQP
jgi:endogenous inhibitor of DNA gyrase (YacG/DUF329 family)